MSNFVVNKATFGMYAKIETGCCKDKHIYKVIGEFNSNSYCDVPILWNSKNEHHEEIVPVLNVIHCGLDETKVIRIAKKDCTFIKPN